MKPAQVLLIFLTFLISVSCSTGNQAPESQLSALGQKKDPQLSKPFLLGLNSISLADVKASRTKCESKKVSKKSWDQLLPIANACVKLRNWRSLEKIATHLAREEVNSPWGAYYLSLVSEARSQFDRSLWMIESALKRAPNESLFVFQKARIFEKKGDFQKSYEWLKISIQKNSELSPAHLALAQIYFQDRQLKKARSHFKAASVIEPNSVESHLGLAETLWYQKKGREALLSMERVVDLAPRNIDYRVFHAEILASFSDKQSEALAAYKKIQRLRGKRGVIGVIPRDLSQRIDQLKLAIQTAKAELAQRTPSQSAPAQEGK